MAYIWEFEARQKGITPTVRGLERLDAVLKSLSDSSKKFTDTFATIGAVFDGLGGKVKKAADAMDKVDKGKAADNMKNTAGAASLLQNAMSAAATAGGGFSSSLMAGLSIVPGYGQALFAASQAVGKFTAAAKGAYDELMKLGVPVDNMERGLEALLTPEELAAGGMERLTKEAEKLSLLPGVEQADVLVGLQSLRKSGNDVNNMLAKIAPSLRLAQAEGRDVGAAAKDVSTVWNIFNRELKAANLTFSDTAEIMAAAAMGAPIQDTNELTRAIKVSGQTFRTYHGDLKDTAAVMMMLAGSEYRGAEAGRAVRSIFDRLAKGVPAVNSALKELGVSITDSMTGKLKTVPVILQELQDAFKNVASEKDAQRLRATLGGQFGNVLKTLVEQGKTGFDKMRQSIEDSKGALDRLQRAKVDSLAGSIELYQSNLNNVKITLAKIIETPVIGFWQTAGNAVGTFGDRLNTLKADFAKLVKQFEGEGQTPLQAWISAFQQFDWSSVWNEAAATVQPVVDLVLKLTYNAASAFQKFLIASIPKAIIQVGRFAVQTAIATAKEAALYAVRIMRNAFDNIVSQVKGIWDFLTGKKQPVKQEVATPDASAGVVVYEADEMQDALDIQTDITAQVAKQRDISAELAESAEKRKKAVEDEQVARAAILQQMDKSLSAEAAMQQAGTQKGQAMSDQYQAEQKRQEAAASADRSKALLISGQRGISFNDAMQQATGDRQKMEGIDAISAMLKQAQQQMGTNKAITENDKRLTETQTNIKNAPLDLAMKQNEVETATKKWLLAPLDQFQTKVMEIFQKFGAIFEGLGRKRVDIGVKSGRLDEEGAKKETADVLEKSVTRGQKLLQLAQSPEQRATALEQQASTLTELGDTTGDRTKYQKADELLKNAMKEREQQQQDELKAVEIEKAGAKTNISLLEKKKDSSASEAVGRLGALMESYKSLGDVTKVKETAAALTRAQAEASGESVSLLKQVVQELQLVRKGLGLELEKGRIESKDAALKSLDVLKRISNESGGSGTGFDPALMLPSF